VKFYEGCRVEYEPISLMEPLMPEQGNRRLEDLAVELVAKASALASQLRPIVNNAVGDLVHSMNCYYSNLIEGHNTHPRDINRALAGNYSQDSKKKCLQLEARAHIEVQRAIDLDSRSVNIVSMDYMTWIHREFCSKLPEELLWVENPDTSDRTLVIPGELRSRNVCVGKHVPPDSNSVKRFLDRFAEVYNPDHLSKLRQVIAVAASHHRLLWIHPFLDGNGRVTRLVSHAYLKQIGIGTSLWSVSRGLARRASEYKDLLMAADQPRWNDLDGRGNLTAAGLQRFCEFFLEVCIDQVEFMTSLLAPSELLHRIALYVEVEVSAGRLRKGSFPLLQEALLVGEFDRGRAAFLTGYQERQARTILHNLVKAGLLVSDGPKKPVRLGFPVNVVERWFPNLYPTAI
jgi:Fic family protein